MQFNRRKKIAAATGMSAVAVMAVVGGTLAQFTDSDTTASQVMTAGTVAVEAVEGGNWTTNLDNLAIGDTKATLINLDNTSTLEVKSLNLTADVNSLAGPLGGVLADRVLVDVTQEAGTTDVVLANDVPLSSFATGGYTLTLGAGLAPATDVELRFDYVVNGDATKVLGAREDSVTNPDNAYQGSTLTVAYTIDAVQRDGIAQP